MKINLRWIIQAMAFIGCIYFFVKLWNTSKVLLQGGTGSALLSVGLYCLGFMLCFFLMAVTSYLKQKFNGTLKNQIPLFEKLLSKLGLT